MHKHKHIIRTIVLIYINKTKHTLERKERKIKQKTGIYLNYFNVLAKYILYMSYAAQMSVHQNLMAYIMCFLYTKNLI